MAFLAFPWSSFFDMQFLLHQSQAILISIKIVNCFRLFYGMSSATAMKKHAGGVSEYRASEGKTVEIPYRYVDKTVVS